MTNNFLLSLSMIGGITHANALLSKHKTNYLMNIEDSINYIWMSHRSYDGCSCLSSSTCTEPATVTNYSNAKSFFTVPGFYAGCYMIESLLQSTLECFFDQECIKQLQAHLSQSSPASINVTAMNSSFSSLYSENSTIKELLDSFMIEQWNVSINYEQYYNQCQSTQCTYTIETRNDLIYIVTTLFGVVGGLTTVLKLILPRLIKLVRKKREEQRTSTGKKNSKRIP
jgi:hypothetical protein